MPAGRPSTYNVWEADVVCERIADGESMLSIHRDETMPSKNTVRKWCVEHPDFALKLAVARNFGFDSIAEKVLEISDDPVGRLDNGATDSGAVKKQELQCNSRKWFLGCLSNKYKERLLVGGDADAPPIKMDVSVDTSEQMAKIEAMFAAVSQARSGD